MGLEWTVPWVAGLRLKALGNYRLTADRQKDWKKSPVMYDWDGNPNTPSKPSLEKNYWNMSEYTVQAFANYDRTLMLCILLVLRPVLRQINICMIMQLWDAKNTCWM